jgi:hypothetical protein
LHDEDQNSGPKMGYKISENKSYNTIYNMVSILLKRRPTIMDINSLLDFI